MAGGCARCLGQKRCDLLARFALALWCSSNMWLARIAVVVLLVACSDKSSNTPNAGTEIASSVLADVKMSLPEGWTSTYDKAADAWDVTIADGVTKVRIERADERHVASPDAYMQHVTPRFGKNKLVTIEEREQLSSGFVVTLAAYAGDNDPAPMRTTFVVRKLGEIWLTCHVDNVEDDTLRRQVIYMCRSVRH